METYTFVNIFDKKQYTITYIGNKFCLCDDTTPAGLPCKTWIKVKPDHEFTFCIQKTQIKAKDGAKGLYDFIKECYQTNILETAVNKIINSIQTGYIKPIIP